MKKLIITLCLLLVVPVAFEGCKSAPSERVQEVKTLKIVGATIEAGMKTAAQMYKNGQITEAQWNRLADLHDNKVQPAFRLAVQTAQADLSSAASIDLLNVVTELSNLILSYQTK